MGVSTVTISIEEFEDLIENKKKVVAINAVMDNNEKFNILPASIKMMTLMSLGKYKEAKAIADKSDGYNIETLRVISKILNEKRKQRR